MAKIGVVYIMASQNRRVLYTGVTSNLPARVIQHKEKWFRKSFSAKYNCCILVYYKTFPSILDAITEEKRIKGGSRKNKEELINQSNPFWEDLWEEIKDW
jgi:putative endonuclease